MHNPVLDPVKAYIRKRGGSWPRYAFNPPNAPRAAPSPGEAAPANRVFVVEPDALAAGRRFAVVAPSWCAAVQRVNLQVS